MARVQFHTAAATLAATVSIAVLAGCPSSPTAPGGTTPNSPVVTPITPVTDPEPPAADDPAAEPTEPTDPGTETPTASDSPAAPLSTDKVTITGIIYDESSNKVDGVTITAKALGGGTFANGTDTLTVSTQQGMYTLEGAPVGATLQVTATKATFAPRQQTFVPVANPNKDTTLNILSFGDAAKEPDLLYALTQKPEVTSCTPAANATGIDAGTNFSLTFSTAVNTTSVESNFAIYVAGTQGQVQSLTSPDVALTNRYDPSKDIAGSSNGLSTVIPDTSKWILDGTAFTPAWTNDNKTVTFTLKPGYRLPTDKDATKLPKLAVSFKGGSVTDATGSYSRTERLFRLAVNASNRVGYAFTVAADTTAPKLSSVTATNKADDAGQNGGDPDVILAKFSEPMVLMLGDQDGKPIPRLATGSGYALLPNMAKYYVSSQGSNGMPNGTSTLPGGFAFDNGNSAFTGFMPLSQGAGAQALWNTTDATRATLQLVPLSDSPTGSGVSWPADTSTGASTTSSITLQGSTTSLNVGDLLQDATTNATGANAVYRVTGIDAANKVISVTQSGGGAAPGNGNVIRYWSTTTGSASSGATSLSLAGLSGLKRGDTLRVTLSNSDTQIITLTSDPGFSTISFAPGLSRSVTAGAAVTYVSPVSTIHTGFGAGYNVWAAINPAVTDPAGNTLDTTGNSHIKAVVVP
jgi:hypothetical protein